ncbi:hypothetical protein P280DRAFT_546427 [Massarina eburnea CBS 473.64]|uniref:F-box domain-containing protein n=1 Tax=Massarina eburnea CBS 473.64 TaxID=1395130 RepID=A0A6A6SB69_9PLEO|nr:hypothetical protein P280DRAFT_546427 [Massarina eburnea CBS 473.64]
MEDPITTDSLTLLDGLAEELVVKILDNFDATEDGDLDIGDVRTLAALALTSKKYNRIATPHLYRNIINDPQGQHTPSNETLKRVFRSRPDLVAHVQSFYTRISDPAVGPILHCIDLLSNLKHLDLRQDWGTGSLTPRVASADALHQILILALNWGTSCDNLQSLAIPTSIYPLDVIDSVCKIPKLDMLHVHIVSFYDNWHIKNAPIKTLPIKTLILTFDVGTATTFAATPCVCEDVKVLTEACPGLETFKLTDNRRMAIDDMDDLFVNMTNALEKPLSRGTLRHVEIWNDTKNICWPPIDDRLGAVDAWTGAYGALHTLKMNTVMLFREQDLTEISTNIIPPTIRTLTLRYHRTNHPTCRVNHMEVAMEFLYTATKAGQFPELRDIAFEATRWMGCMWLDGTGYLGRCKDLQALGIKVELRLLSVQ